MWPMETEVTRPKQPKWGFSSAGRAPALHAGGQEFESPNLHHFKKETFKVSFLCRVFININYCDSHIFLSKNLQDFFQKFHT